MNNKRAQLLASTLASLEINFETGRDSYGNYCMRAKGFSIADEDHINSLGFTINEGEWIIDRYENIEGLTVEQYRELIDFVAIENIDFSSFYHNQRGFVAALVKPDHEQIEQLRSFGFVLKEAYGDEIIVKYE